MYITWISKSSTSLCLACILSSACANSAYKNKCVCLNTCMYTQIYCITCSTYIICACTCTCTVYMYEHYFAATKDQYYMYMYNVVLMSTPQWDGNMAFWILYLHVHVYTCTHVCTDKYAYTCTCIYMYILHMDEQTNTLLIHVYTSMCWHSCAELVGSPSHLISFFSLEMMFMAINTFRAS